MEGALPGGGIGLKVLQKLVIAVVEAAFYLDFILAGVEFIDDSCTMAPPWFSLLMCQYWILTLPSSPLSAEAVPAAAGECREHQCGGKYGRDCTFFVRHGFVSS